MAAEALVDLLAPLGFLIAFAALFVTPHRLGGQAPGRPAAAG